jgi:hypothetical protein
MVVPPLCRAFHAQAMHNAALMTGNGSAVRPSPTGGVIDGQSFQYIKQKQFVTTRSAIAERKRHGLNRTPGC